MIKNKKYDIWYPLNKIIPNIPQDFRFVKFFLSIHWQELLSRDQTQFTRSKQRLHTL